VGGVIQGGFREVHWRSRALGKHMVFALHLPSIHQTRTDIRFAALFILHGSGHDHRSVLSQIRLQDHVSILSDIILIVPDGDQGWWLDSPLVRHSRYAQYLLELVELVDARYPTTPHRDARGLCGFSMGGYGAMALAAQRPELFGSASSLIGTLDIVQMFRHYHRLQLLLGSDMQAWQEANPTQQVARLAKTRLLFCTAEHAFDRPQNEAFSRALQSCAIPFTFRIYPGEHSTAFAQEHIGECLTFHRRAFDDVQHGS
jgi:S-formylglutathione hydrolase FrmB